MTLSDTSPSPYNANLVKASLKLEESRVIASLLLQGVDEAQWRQAILVDSVLQKRSPGTASTFAVFLDGRPIDGSSLLRRFLAAHHTARTDGQRLEAPLSSGIWGGVKTETHLENIRRIHDQSIPDDVYWIDAGWYGTPESCSAIEFTGKWRTQVGNWSPNPVAHPEGMRPIGDAAEAAGLRFLLWFEPERAIWGTQVTQEHPEWFLGDPMPGHSALVKLGNAEARDWLTEFVSRRIDDWKIKVFRQDFSMDPLDYWRLAEAPDRQGMTEIGHVQGLYAFWDELLRHHPGLIIDNCASGGRRIDLWRSDYQCVPGALPLAAEYRMEDADTGETWVQAGRSLADDGLTVTIDEARQSRLLFYAKRSL